MADTYTIDFETYYDQDYSLSKMQTEAYVEDPRFEVIGMGICKEDGPTHWFTGADDVQHVLSRIDWNNAVVRAHHTHFDGLILAHRFGVRPALWKDTLAQGRIRWPYLRQHSLAALAKHTGLPDKGDEVIHAKGKRLADFTPAELAKYGTYCMGDTGICRGLGVILDEWTPPLHEYLIDMTVRMFTEPMLVGDTALMQKLYEDELARKAKLLESAAVDRSIIMSGDKLAAQLKALGVNPPRKLSAKTGKETWAFAKTDKAFNDLLEHDDPQVQALVAARLGVKSTIAETRALTYRKMSERGPLRVYLSMWGAKTTGRYAGGNSANWQNIPARGPAAGLREAVCAPPGYDIVVGDSSNIELRTVMVLAGQWDVVEKIRNGVDLYCDFASRLFGRPITKADKAERQLGKVAMLSLQYGAGASRFQEMVRLEAAKNPDLKPITPERAMGIVALYRQVHHKVVELWNHCNAVILPAIARGDFGRAVDVNGWFIVQNEGFGRPGEPGVVYHNLQFNAKERTWEYQMGKDTVRIFGPKIVENLCLDGATPVLTDRGWVPLHALRGEKVHDGVEFVTHGGIVFKGVKQVIEVDGLRMTPDHEVLTDEGWKAASLVQRPHRPDLRNADGSAPHGVEEREMALAFSVYLRNREGFSRGEPEKVEAAVWDILNCGPRNRFVVLGANGPFIVHNCQHAAMLIVMWQTARINRRFPVRLSVHDEAVTVVPKAQTADAEAYMLECLSTAPAWCRGVIPVAGEVGHGATYGAAK